ncbi:alpha/beta hydrolase [Ktedonobacter sp. SOSP1-52]|uniref:alpha/beta fold hydrolase n=1 Tax=Ktedonobacter sp. SOSP1-52 TaxID=2778366 RepID=UPI00191629F6|nr:alpha/beta hydrolase [Ktedonobacter sp. SOSP1-52]GHO63709.1 alpha/beta hydrolase [Ktedonobacter sp. SOSP1-52]
MAESLEKTAQSQMIDLPSGRFHYLSWGAEQTELPGIVLLHGMTSSALNWVRVGPALTDRYRVYALDMRGHGESIAPPRGTYSLRQTADDGVAFIEALGLQRPALLGHSWGGATAIVLASGAGSQKPVPQFSHLILGDPPPGLHSVSPELQATVIRDIGRPAQQLRAEITVNNPDWTEAEVEARIDALHKVTKEAVESIYIDARKEGNLLPLLATIAAPTLLIRADPHLGTPLDDTAWQQAKLYLPAHSRAVQVNGATHGIHRGRTFDAFMQTVNDFLSDERSVW